MISQQYSTKKFIYIKFRANIVEKGTISSGIKNNQILSIEKNDITPNSNIKPNNISKMDNNKEIKGPNHLKIIPSSGVIYKNSENKRIGDEIYRNKKGRMSYKEYILLKRQYMNIEQNNNTKNKTFNNISESKESDIKKDDKIKIRSKSKCDKIRNNNNKDNIKGNIKNVKKEEKKNKNFDENGIEVLNENLFKNRKEYKPLRKTFTGTFFRKKINQQTAYGNLKDKINFIKK